MHSDFVFDEFGLAEKLAKRSRSSRREIPRSKNNIRMPLFLVCRFTHYRIIYFILKYLKGLIFMNRGVDLKHLLRKLRNAHRLVANGAQKSL
jgi:hypothetical protein